jgi:hypothetical protein
MRFVTAKPVIYFGLIYDIKVISSHFGLKTVAHISPIAVEHATDLYQVLARFNLFAPEML